MSATTLAVSTTRSTRRNRVYVAPNRNVVLNAIFEAAESKATAPQISEATGLQVGSPYLILLEKQGLITRRGHLHDNTPGRPPVLWALTDKGRKRVKRARS